MFSDVRLRGENCASCACWFELETGGIGECRFGAPVFVKEESEDRDRGYSSGMFPIVPSSCLCRRWEPKHTMQMEAVKLFFGVFPNDDVDGHIATLSGLSIAGESEVFDNDNKQIFTYQPLTQSQWQAAHDALNT